MPKMKTRKSASKRYRVTGSGKVAYKKMGLRHILTKKSSKRKMNLRESPPQRNSLRRRSKESKINAPLCMIRR